MKHTQFTYFTDNADQARMTLLCTNAGAQLARESYEEAGYTVHLIACALMDEELEDDAKMLDDLAGGFITATPHTRTRAGRALRRLENALADLAFKRQKG